MSQTITARFGSLRRAVAESRKYGVSHTYEAIEHQLMSAGNFTHDITHDRHLTITRAQGGKWKMAVDVSGRVVPAGRMPKLFLELVTQPQFG